MTKMKRRVLGSKTHVGTDRKLKIVEWFRAHPKATRAKIAARFNVSASFVSKLITRHTRGDIRPGAFTFTVPKPTDSIQLKVMGGGGGGSRGTGTDSDHASGRHIGLDIGTGGQRTADAKDINADSQRQWLACRLGARGMPAEQVDQVLRRTIPLDLSAETLRDLTEAGYDLKTFDIVKDNVPLHCEAKLDTGDMSVRDVLASGLAALDKDPEWWRPAASASLKAARASLDTDPLPGDFTSKLVGKLEALRQSVVERVGNLLDVIQAASKPKPTTMGLPSFDLRVLRELINGQPRTWPECVGIVKQNGQLVLAMGTMASDWVREEWTGILTAALRPGMEQKVSATIRTGLAKKFMKTPDPAEFGAAAGLIPEIDIQMVSSEIKAPRRTLSFPPEELGKHIKPRTASVRAKRRKAAPATTPFQKRIVASLKTGKKLTPAQGKAVRAHSDKQLAAIGEFWNGKKKHARKEPEPKVKSPGKKRRS